MASVWTAALTVMLFLQTVRYVTHSERKLTSFLQSLGQNDFSATFPEIKQSADYDLNHAFNRLNDLFVKLRSEREAGHQLLRVVVEHAAIPLICIEVESGEVFLINEAAKSLFGCPYLRKIDGLNKVDAGLPRLIQDAPEGERIQWKIRLEDKLVILSVSARHIAFDGKLVKLVAFADVSSELAEKEAETWRKLLRVLTHEISNSAIPLSTLSSYIHETVANAQSENRDLTSEEREDIRESLRTIDQRSRSLKDFVENFKSVNQIPDPRPERINLRNIIADTSLLYSRELEKENILMLTENIPEVFVYADRNLTFQVVINLIKNAIEAMTNMREGKSIEVSVSKKGNQFVQLNLRDTGPGIASEDLEQIFIPFYSTKQGGSGIGLSVSQQIMQKQKGDISVRSVSGKGSVFMLTFLALK